MTKVQIMTLSTLLLFFFCPSHIEANILPLKVYVDEVQNETELKIYENRFAIAQDILPEKIKNEFITLLKHSPLIDVVSVDSSDSTKAKLSLSGFVPKRSDNLGTTTKAKIRIRAEYYKQGDAQLRRREYFVTDSRWNPLYEEDVFKTPWWDRFEASVYWQGIKKALREAKDDLYAALTDQGVRGRIIEVSDQRGQLGQKRFFCNLGFRDSVGKDDTLLVISQRRLNSGYDYYEIKGKLKIVTAYENLSLVEVIEENPKDPIMPGDDVLFSTLSYL